MSDGPGVGGVARPVVAMPSIGAHQRTGPRPLVLRDPAESHRASTWLELFFDLCFVIAVSALARDLHHHPDVDGLLRFLGLLVPVWWAWMGFTWFATAFDNDDTLHRIAYLTAGLGIVWLAASVEGVAAGADTSFVLAYAFVNLVLVGLFWRARSAPTEARPWAHRSVIGNGLGVAIWVASLAVPAPARYLVWVAGTAVLMATPLLAVRAIIGDGYRVRVFHPGHIRERYGLFTIIVLGESLLAVASGTAGSAWSPAAVAVGVLGFGLAASVWWLYFGHVRSDALTLSATAAFFWGYGHLFIYAGIAAIGVGVQLTIESVAPDAPAAVTDGARLVLCAGAAVLLAAMAFIALTTTSLRDAGVRARLLAAAGVVTLGVAGALVTLPAAVVAAGVFAIVAGLTIWQERRTAA